MTQTADQLTSPAAAPVASTSQPPGAGAADLGGAQIKAGYHPRPTNEA